MVGRVSDRRAEEGAVVNPGQTWTDRFHQHLDECERCREHPFDLCKIGVSLIQKAAQSDLVLPPNQTFKRRTS